MQKRDKAEGFRRRFEVGEKYLPRFPEKPSQDSARPLFISGRDGRSDRSDARGVTAVTQGDGGEACGEMKDGVNLRAAAFHSRICARLNFPRGGRQEAAGRPLCNSVNVTGCERPAAAACRSLPAAAA